jgi:hypothetical protein
VLLFPSVEKFFLVEDFSFAPNTRYVLSADFPLAPQIKQDSGHFRALAPFEEPLVIPRLEHVAELALGYKP